MKEIISNILIVGGGMSGLLSALALSTTKNQIIVIDKNFFTDASKTKNDFRTTAIAEGSKKFFEEIKLWTSLKKHSELINNIRVFDRNEKSKINFYNSKTSNPLGYVLRNTHIKTEIIKLLKRKKNIILLENENLKNISFCNEYAEVITKRFKIKTNLVLATDGKFSSVRNIFNTPAYSKLYKHKALVVNFSHTKNHKNIAYEIFHKTGPLAILPMKSNSSKYYCSSLIWSNEIKYINSLIKIKPNLLKNIVEEKISQQVGEIIKLFDIKAFNLSAHLNTKFFERRLVYLGDSAHSIHPIAGQGWNLGVRDVKNILEVIIDAQNLGLDIGANYVCKKYHDLSFYDAYVFYQITDKLNSVFLKNNILSLNIRRLGFKIIEKNKDLKNFISNFAMGF
jgi:2-octaprenyl-6-methoxyphenol hydroxylase